MGELLGGGQGGTSIGGGWGGGSWSNVCGGIGNDGGLVVIIVIFAPVSIIRPWGKVEGGGASHRHCLVIHHGVIHYLADSAVGSGHHERLHPPLRNDDGSTNVHLSVCCHHFQLILCCHCLLIHLALCCMCSQSWFRTGGLVHNLFLCGLHDLIQDLCSKQGRHWYQCWCQQLVPSHLMRYNHYPHLMEGLILKSTISHEWKIARGFERVTTQLLWSLPRPLINFHITHLHHITI